MSGSTKLFIFVVVALVGVSLWFGFRRSPYQHALQARSVATWGLASDLARRYPGTHALVVSNPFAQRKGASKAIEAVEDAGIRGLKQAFGTAITIDAVLFPEVRQEAKANPRAVHIPDTTTPLSYLVAEDALDRMAGKHPGCEMIISLIGLPANLHKVEVWRRAGAPRFGLLLPDLRMLGTAQALRDAVQSGKLPAFVLRKPDGLLDHVPVRDDFAEEFKKRFVLVTADNIDEMLRTHPDLSNLQTGKTE